MKTSKKRLVYPGQMLPTTLYDLARDLAGPDPDLGEWTRALQEAADKLGYTLLEETVSEK